MAIRTRQAWVGWRWPPRCGEEGAGGAEEWRRTGCSPGGRAARTQHGVEVSQACHRQRKGLPTARQANKGRTSPAQLHLRPRMHVSSSRLPSRQRRLPPSPPGVPPGPPPAVPQPSASLLNL